MRLLLLALAVWMFPSFGNGLVADEVMISGEQKVWHRVQLDIPGPKTGEQAKPNPFRDYRVNVRFSRAKSVFHVPAFYAADGDAAESGAEEGSVWRCYFTPNEPGEWSYTVSFRSGEDVALSTDIEAGKAVGNDGASGTFTVAESDKTGRDFRAHGRLQYVNRHHLRFAGTKKFFLKGGADSPENLLGYADFDATYSRKRNKNPRHGEALAQGLHTYKPHRRDWNEGDPTWRDGKGKSLIGAMNYLSGTGMNSVYFLTMNVTGDGDDVWPWIAPDRRDRFDCSKLDQWEIVFTHMQQRGLMLHVITQETENDQLLDGGDLGPLRKLYYRELVARFGHHLAICWNLGEENTNTTPQRKAFAEYIREVDPYDSPIVIHTFPGKYDEVYNGLLGDSNLTGPSLQTNDTRRQTLRWRRRSAAAGHPWVVCLDEIGPASTGVKPDSDDPRHDVVRKKHLWGNLMAGGAGAEWYFGYKFAHNDLNAEDWRSRAEMWRQTEIALTFFQEHVPFAEATPTESLSRGDSHTLLTVPGMVTVLYFPEGGTATVQLGKNCGPWSVRWLKPTGDGELLQGSITTITEDGWQSVGKPPTEPDARKHGNDWVCLLRSTAEDRDTHELFVTEGLGRGDYPAGAAVPIYGLHPLVTKSFTRWEAKMGLVDDPEQQESYVIMPAEDAKVSGIYNTVSGVEVTGIMLIDTEKRRGVPAFKPIPNGSVIDLAKLPTRRLNLQAEISGGTPEAVRLEMKTANLSRTEREAPYTLAGDRKGSYDSMTLPTGKHVITAQPLRGGQPFGKALTIRVTVIDSAENN